MLEGIVRESTSKQATKQLRKDGYLIANIYGAGAENISAVFKMSDFVRYMRKKETLAFDIKVGDATCKVMVQEYQKHPLTNELTHVDLRTITGDKVAKFLIPVETTGTPVGLKNRGVLVYNKKRIAVRCKPENLPEKFVLDVTNLDTGDAIAIREIEAPEGVTFVDNPSVSIVGMIKAK